MKKAEHADPEDYAGFWVRAGSMAIDGSILSLVTVPSGILFLRSAHPTISSEIFFMFLLLPFTLLVQILYFGWFNADGRQSPGKRFFGLMVVDASLKPVPLSQSLWRDVTYIIDVTGLLLVPFNRIIISLWATIATIHLIAAIGASSREKTSSAKPVSFIGHGAAKCRSIV